MNDVPFRQGQQLFRRILGIDFFYGSAHQAIARMKSGGLLVVPAAPALKDIDTNQGYRDSLLDADLCITDSSFMVLSWNLLRFDRVRRLSGLEYLRELLQDPSVRTAGNTLWIMASPSSARQNLNWLRTQGIMVPEECVYLAPMYREGISDPELLGRIDRLKPDHVIVTVGGGTQEQLGHYLKQHLSYRPAIHCIGAAIAFLSGDQVRIPVWADRHYLGWIHRCLADPKRFLPRYWQARRLFVLIYRYRDALPPMLQ